MTLLLPPPDIATRAPLLKTVRAGTSLHRFYTAAYEPIFYDRSLSGRFNAPDGSYGVLYAARSRAGAFAETFLREPGRTQIAADFLARKAYVRLKALANLALIDFTGPGLAILGATAEVPHGSLPYDSPQAWSKALHDHPAGADGIAFHARHDDRELSYALFGRAEAKIGESIRRKNLDTDWFWRLTERYRVGFLPA